MGKMISGARAAPVQVGVWIPKPNWTNGRLFQTPWNAQYLRQASRWHHCCSNHESNLCIYAPSQVVMNCFKEPQHAVNAIQTLLDSDVPMAALLADLSKAFERVNPYWMGRGWGPQYHVQNRGGGPVRVRENVKLGYSAGELLKASVPSEP